jgi:DNA primase
MFPIRNVKGQVIAFGGRVLGDEKPKYLNSPETPIFHKGQELYGLYEARKIRQKLTRMIIVEGYMDVVALAEYGIHYAVATLGTATSEHHIRRLFKVVPEIIFCFDGDKAGRTAAQRAMETVIPALQDGLQARFLFLPDGEDPDTIVRKEGKEAFEKRLDNSKHLPEFVFENIKEQVDFDTLDGKARFGQLAAPLISRLPTGMLKELMQQQLAQETGIKQEVLAKLLPTETEKPNQHRTITRASTDQSASSSPEQDATTHHYDEQQYHGDEEQDFDVGDFIDVDGEHQIPSEAQSQNSEVRTNSKEDKQLATLTLKALTLLVKFPESAQRIESLEDFEPEDENERLLCEILKKLKQSPQNSSIGLLIQWTATPFAEILKNIANQPLELPAGIDPSNDIEGILQRLHHRALRREWQSLQDKIARESISKLSAEEKARYLALPQQLKKHKK